MAVISGHTTNSSGSNTINGKTQIWVGTYDYDRIGVKNPGDIFYVSCLNDKLKIENLPIRVNNGFNPNNYAPYGFGFYTDDLILPDDEFFTYDGVFLQMSNTPITQNISETVKYTLDSGKVIETSPLNPPDWNEAFTEQNNNLFSAQYPDLWMLGGYMFSFWHTDSYGKTCIKISVAGVPDQLHLVINPGDELYLATNGYIECHIPFIVKTARIEGNEIAIYTDSFVLPERYNGTQYDILTQDVTISNYPMRNYIDDVITYTLSDQTTTFIAPKMHPPNITTGSEPFDPQYRYFIDATGNDYDVIAVTGRPSTRTANPLQYTPGGIELNAPEPVQEPEPVVQENIFFPVPEEITTIHIDDVEKAIDTIINESTDETETEEIKKSSQTETTEPEDTTEIDLIDYQDYEPVQELDIEQESEENSQSTEKNTMSLPSQTITKTSNYSKYLKYAAIVAAILIVLKKVS